MFRVQDTILSEDIALAQFSCDLFSCRGGCCVVGDAGAPVSREEVPVLRKAFKLLKEELEPEAVEEIRKYGLVRGDNESGFELSCTGGKECVFVTYEGNIAKCAIQKAYYEGRFSWEKPLSCHLFPVRLKRITDFDYANFEYIPELCEAGCARGEKEGVWLADFLEQPLTRRYGEEWYEEFTRACKKIRERQKETPDI